MTAGTPPTGEANARPPGSEGLRPTAVVRQASIAGLNHDLAGEYQTIVMYTHYSAK